MNFDLGRHVSLSRADLANPCRQRGEISRRHGTSENLRWRCTKRPIDIIGLNFRLATVLSALLSLRSYAILECYIEGTHRQVARLGKDVNYWFASIHMHEPQSDMRQVWGSDNSFLASAGTCWVVLYKHVERLPSY